MQRTKPTSNGVHRQVFERRWWNTLGPRCSRRQAGWRVGPSHRSWPRAGWWHSTFCQRGGLPVASKTTNDVNNTNTSQHDSRTAPRSAARVQTVAVWLTRCQIKWSVDGLIAPSFVTSSVVVCLSVGRGCRQTPGTTRTRTSKDKNKLKNNNNNNNNKKKKPKHVQGLRIAFHSIQPRPNDSLSNDRCWSLLLLVAACIF